MIRRVADLIPGDLFTATSSDIIRLAVSISRGTSITERDLIDHMVCVRPDHVDIFTVQSQLTRKITILTR